VADYRIVVQIDPSRAKAGRRAVEGELSGIDRAAKRTQMAIGRALAFAGISVGVAGLISLTDQYTELQNRLRTVTTSTGQLTRATNDLYAVSRRTRVAFADTVELYTRTAQASKNLGLSYQELLTFTESVNQAVILSGATASEAAGGLRQLSQGLATGTLRGDELISVLENLPVVADVIAKQLGVTRGELRQLGADGKISAQDIVEGFQAARVELEERFARTVPTIKQGFIALRDSTMKLFGEFTTGTSIAAVLASALFLLADNLDTVMRVATALAIVLGVRYVSAVVGGAVAATVLYIRQLIALEMALGATSRMAALTGVAMKALQVLLLANPITFLITALTTAIALLVSFSDKIRLGGESTANLQDLFMSFFSEVGRIIQPALDALSEFFSRVGDAIRSILPDFDFSIRGIVIAHAKGMDMIIGGALAAINVIKAIWSGLPGAIGDMAYQAVNMFIRAWNNIPETVAEILNNVVTFFGAAYEGIIAGARALPGNIASFFRQAFSRAVEIARSAIGAIAKALLTMSTAALDAFRGGAEEAPALGAAIADGVRNGLSARSNVLIDAATFRLTEVANPFEGQARALGLNIGNGIQEGMQFSGVSDFVGRVLEGADARAAARDAAGTGDGGGGGGATNPAANDNDGSKSRSRTFQDYVDDLREEAELLRLSGIERDIRAEQLSIEDGLNRRLTTSENALVEALVRELDVFQRQSDILEAIHGPVADYMAQIAALSGLLEQGRISQAAFNAEVANLQLVRDLQDVDLSLEGTLLQYEAERQLLRDNEAEKMLIVEQGLAARLLTEQEAANRRVEIEADTQRRLRELEVARQSVALTAASDTASSLADIAKASLGEQSAVYKAMFIASKAFAIADSIIKIQQGVANALALPFPANLGAVAAVAAQAASIVSNIQAVGLNLAKGGMVRGPGTSTSDSIPANLSDGEYVIRASAASRNKPLLDAINSGKSLRGASASAANDRGANGLGSLKVYVNNMAPGVEHETRQISATEVEIIARRVVAADAPKVVAGQMRNPNSTVSKAVSQNTTAGRRRGA
jgi:tape measure domain-containing protein